MIFNYQENVELEVTLEEMDDVQLDAVVGGALVDEVVKTGGSDVTASEQFLLQFYSLFVQ